MEIDYEHMLLNRFKMHCDLTRARDHLERLEDPTRLAALRAFRLYRPGRAGVLIQYLARTTSLSFSEARRALIRAMDDRANNRGRMDARDQVFFGELLTLDPV